MELKWVSGKPAVHFGRVVELGDAPDFGDGVWDGELRFGPGATLRLRVEQRGGRDVLLLDRDFDRNLDEEKPVELDLELPDAAAFMSGNLSLHVEAIEEVQPPWAATEGLDGSVRIHIKPIEGESDFAYRITPLLHRRGRVEMEGRTRMVTVYDGDGDLRFDDPEEDLLFLDTDGDRSITMGLGSRERVRAGRAIRVRSGNYVGIVEGPFASRVRFERTDGVADLPRPWVREETPPVGVQHEGEARRLETIMADYVRLKGRVKRGRSALIDVRSLIEEAGRVGSDQALAFLQRVYKAHSDVGVRSSVARALGDTRYREGAPFLRYIATRSRDQVVTIVALEALRRMDAPGRQKLLAGIAKKTRHMRVYRAAVLELAYLGTPESTETLRKLIRANGKKGGRAYEAYRVLTRFSPDAPTDDLITLAARVNHRRLSALALTHALSLPHPRARDLALACLKAHELTPITSAAIVEALGRTGDGPSVRALLHAAPGLDEQARARMVRLLQPVREAEATALLLKALSSKHVIVRVLAARIVGGLSDPAIGGLLGKRIGKEGDPAARLALAYAIAAQDAKGALPALLRVLESQKIGAQFERIVLDVLIGIGLGDSEVVEFLLARMRSSRWETRLRLMDAALEQAELASAPILLAGLGDERWQVRLVAAQGLQAVRVKQAVPPLIDQLDGEEHARVRSSLELALFKTTGMNLYDQVKVWRRWWSEQGAGFEVPPQVGDPPSSDRGNLYGTFFGIPVDFQRVIFVIDQSGSMDSSYSRAQREGESGTDFQRAVRQTRRVVEQLPDGALVNVIFFESDVRPWRKGLVELNAGTREALYEYLDKQRPMGGTNLFDGLEMAVRTPGVETIYVLSDGSPTAGKFTSKPEILKAIGDLNWGPRAVIHCVAMGWASDLLRDLAAQNEGSYAVR